MEKNYQDQFYYSQNLQIRKQIRQYDLRLAQGETVPAHCNFLLAGPPKIGKSSLLKTLQFALNGSQGWGISRKNHHTTVEIKKGSRYQVEGTKELKQIAQKFGVQGIEISTDEKPAFRYKKALQFVENSFGHCMMESREPQHRFKAKVCLMMLNLAMDVSPEQLAYLKHLKTNMLQRGVKVFLVLVGGFNRTSSQLESTEGRILAFQNEFELKRDDVICLETYLIGDNSAKQGGRLVLKQSQVPTSKVESSEEINFYALQLLQRIIQENERNSKMRSTKIKGWLCNWA